MTMPDGPIALPLAFELFATFVSAVAGAIAAAQRRYDPVGVFALALVGGLGGSLIRDGIYLQSGPPAAVRDDRILAAVLAGGLAGMALGQWSPRLERGFLVLDAVGLGVYAVVGADRALAAGVGGLGAVLVGVTNAVGGGVLRDVLTREEPLLFKPGQFYGLAAVAGAGLYVAIRTWVEIPSPTAAGVAVAVGTGLRLLAVYFDWRTPPAYWRHWLDEAAKEKKGG